MFLFGLGFGFDFWFVMRLILFLCCVVSFCILLYMFVKKIKFDLVVVWSFVWFSFCSKFGLIYIWNLFLVFNLVWDHFPFCLVPWTHLEVCQH